MLRKTPIRRGCKYLPIETDGLRNAIVAIREDAEREGMLEQPHIRVVQTATEALDALAAPEREPGDDDDTGVS